MFDINYYNEKFKENIPTVDVSNLVTKTELGSAISNLENIELVTYTGKGTYGASNPTTISFSFAPKHILWIGMALETGSISHFSEYHDKGHYSFRNLVTMSEMTTSYTKGKGFAVRQNSTNAKDDIYGKKSADGKTLYFYHQYYYADQLNDSNYKYYFLAIG